MVDLPIRIQEKRLEKGFNKSKLAALLGITGTAIKQYEDGKNYPKTEVLLAMSKVLEWDFINDGPLVDHKDLSQKSNIASKEINNLLGNNTVENSDITLREPGDVNQKSNFHLGGGGGSAPTHPKELLQLIDNQQKQIDLLYQNADLLRSQVALLNNLILK